MTHIERLNKAIKTILADDLINEDAWADVFLSILVLSRMGYTFKSKVTFDLSDIVVKTVHFGLKNQLIIISESFHDSIITEQHDFYMKLHAYEKHISKRGTVVEETIKIYDTDYFVKHGKQIHYMLPNHPLLDCKIESIIERYRRHSK